MQAGTRTSDSRQVRLEDLYPDLSMCGFFGGALHGVYCLGLLGRWRNVPRFEVAHHLGGKFCKCFLGKSSRCSLRKVLKPYELNDIPLNWFASGISEQPVIPIEFSHLLKRFIANSNDQYTHGQR